MEKDIIEPENPVWFVLKEEKNRPDDDVKV